MWFSSFFSQTTKIINGLGPGLLYAGAAVGVSHLVMSTKAGASYAFLFLLLIPLVHIIKYPFYKFGPEYTALTGQNILHGYYALGKWALMTYVVLTVLSMCLIQAAVTIVTSSIAIHFFNVDVSPEFMPHIPAILVLLTAAVILYVGQYSVLDKVMKVIIIILTITTFSALGSVLLSSGEESKEGLNAVFDMFEYSDIVFLAAFIGWMPAPMDVSVWHSVWSEEDNNKNGYCSPLKKAMLDFKIGYFGTALLAMIFLSLGAMVMFGGSEKPSENGAEFAGQLIDMYTQSLGSWAYPLIGVAALATMFSTTLTCLDAYPRTLGRSYIIWKANSKSAEKNDLLISGHEKIIYQILLVIAVTGTIVVFFLIKNVAGAMGYIVTIATIISFISAPVIACLNYKVMCGNTIEKDDRPNKVMRLWSQVALMIMIFFSLAYLALVILR